MTRRTLILLASLVIVAVIGWRTLPGSDAAPLLPKMAWEEAPGTAAAGPGRADDGPAYFTSEQEWIVWEIARTIVAAARPDGSGTRLPSVVVRMRPATPEELFNTATIDVTVEGGGEFSLFVEEHVWWPRTYVEMARALLGVGREADGGGGRSLTGRLAGLAGSLVPNALSGGTPPLFETLTDPRIEVILREEARVSSALVSNRLDQTAHEEAALLAAVLAMRESAGWFTDTRPTLSRATAHLAVARAFSGPGGLGPDGQVAEAILSTMAGREDIAMVAIDRLSGSGNRRAMEDWQTALRLRLVGDWREVDAPASRSLLVRIEYLRTLSDRGGAARTVEFLDQVVGDPVADWHRVALEAEEGYRFFVDRSHELVDHGYDLEFREMASVWRHYFTGEPTPEILISSLARRDNDEGRALDWNVWSGFLQRHLCALLVSSAVRDIDEAVDLEQRTWRALAERPLPLFPFVLVRAADSKEQFLAAVQVAARLTDHYPEMFTARLAETLRAQRWFMERRLTITSDTPWFTPHVPTGTVFELGYRSLAASCARHASIEQLEIWASRAPHNTYLNWSLAWRRVPGKPSVAEERQALAQVIDYDVGAVGRMIQNLDASHEEYLWLADLWCRIDANECHRLPPELLFAGREAEAIAAYDEYLRRADSDRVGVAGHVWWYARFAWDSGQRDRAAELAQLVPERESVSLALQTAGEFLERQGRDEEARARFQAAWNRYADARPLAAYYLRKARTTGDRQWDALAAALLPELFPNGLERVDRSMLVNPPPDGAAFASYGPRAAQVGLLPDDVIVGVDGYRVRGGEQYSVVARAPFEAEIRLTVWRNGRYIDLEGRMPQRNMFVRMADHPMPKDGRRIILR